VSGGAAGSGGVLCRTVEDPAYIQLTHGAGGEQWNKIKEIKEWNRRRR
jgi:hypothetical protein